MPTIRTKRIYDPPVKADGARILVDRLWPRGVSSDKAALDAWMKDLAPSSDLRTWFHKDRSRFDEFARRYRAELESSDLAEALDDLRPRAVITLLYAARGDGPNHADILADFLRRALEAADF